MNAFVLIPSNLDRRSWYHNHSTSFNEQASEDAQATVSEQDKVQELLAQRQRENTRRIEQQDTAPQANLVAENLQASTAAVKFEVFGQTQEAINGEPPWLI